MGKYKESYINLYHGTTVDAANEIIATQQFIPSNMVVGLKSIIHLLGCIIHFAIAHLIQLSMLSC